jgi:quercetin dioxygenase-like cupin family protein
MNPVFDLLTPHFCTANEGGWIELGDHRGRPIVASEHTAGSMVLAEVQADFLGGVPPHIHSAEDETFHILEGRFSIGIAKEALFAGPGDTVFAPRGISHTWRCMSEEGGRLLLLITPGENFERYIRKVAEHSAVPGDPSSMAAIVALSNAHGITMLPPSQATN